MAYHIQITHGIYLQHFSEQRVPSEKKIGPICTERNIVRLLFVCFAKHRYVFAKMNAKINETLQFDIQRTVHRDIIL